MHLSDSDKCIAHDSRKRLELAKMNANEVVKRKGEYYRQVMDELRGPHDVTTNKGIAAAVNKVFNALCASQDPECPDPIPRQSATAMGFLLSVAGHAVRAVQEEQEPADTIGKMLDAGINITMSKEERKMYLTAGSSDKRIQILKIAQERSEGEVIELSEKDGVFAVAPMEKPPARDMQTDHKGLAQVCQAGGLDVTKEELHAAFGTSPSTQLPAGGDIELFGFDEAFGMDATNTPALGHTWKQITVFNDAMPGVALRRSECTKCGITTNNTKKHDGEECKVLG